MDLSRRAGLPLLFLTHNLPLARSIADDVVVMQAGAISEEGSVNDVLRAPKDPYPAQLLADAPKRRSRGNGDGPGHHAI
jgi:ABC-type dipeptide/oligopeptide/nickel transport system ATPase component